MITNTITMTTPTNLGMASGFGMPMCGHDAFATRVTAPQSVDFRTPVIVRDRAAAAKGHLGLIAYVPGTNAWSPPIC